ncbi:MAG: phospholipid carrier-dependent glycosyltransferase [Pirellulaceae bacterium]|nr:phospholipid carrier-dependent glycosyltransferase [Pirellulaceae bacterium]
MIDWRRQFIPLLIIAFAIRAAVLWFGAADMNADPDSYARIATTLAKTGTLGFEGEAGPSPTAFRPPLYPWLLSWFVVDGQVARAGVAGLHLLLGCATVALTFLIGVRLRLRFAWLAGVAVAVDPILLRQSQLVMTETLATFLGVFAWWLWLVAWPSMDTGQGQQRSRRQWMALAAFSLTLGVSILARPTAAPWALLCALIALFVGCDCWKRRVNDCVLICLGVLVCVVPWTLRNYSTFGKPIWATTHGGYTLLLANNPPLYRHFIANGPSRAWEAEEFQDAWSARVGLEVPPLNEVGEDELAYLAARSTIARYWYIFPVSCIYRVGWLWALWPYDGSFGAKEVIIGVWYAVIFVLAYMGLLRIRITRSYRPWLIGLAMTFSLSAIHSIYWSNMRMRAPVMPCVILLILPNFVGGGKGLITPSRS